MASIEYSLPISMGTQTANIPINSTIWAMRVNPASIKNIYFSKFQIVIGYDAGGSPKSSQFGFHRFTGGTPSGGTVLIPAKGNSAFVDSNVIDARQIASGSLTMSGITVESTPLIFTMNQRSPNATTTETYEFEDYEGIILRPGEGLCLRLAIVGESGDYIAGSVMWKER